MNFLEALASMNKISLIAFVITLVSIIYEIKQMRKTTAVRQKPVIPSFDPGNPSPTGFTQIIVKENKGVKPIKHHIIISSILIVMGIFFAFVSFSSIKKDTEPQIEEQNQVQVEEVQSSGIKVFDSNWQEISGNSTSAVDPGTTVYVGIANIIGADIDQARIKINEEAWTQNHVTKEYNNVYNVFYIPYIIKEGEDKLVIEAQLHSAADGWLSE